MYAFLTSLDTSAYNLNTINSEPGTFKGFDVLFIDPTHLVADAAVNYEMCEVGLILEQAKAMASLDYAAIGDNLTRELLVIMVDSPKAREEISKMKDAAVCAQGVAQEYQEAANEEDEDEDFESWENEDDPSLSFAADP